VKEIHPTTLHAQWNRKVLTFLNTLCQYQRFPSMHPKLTSSKAKTRWASQTVRQYHLELTTSMVMVWSGLIEDTKIKRTFSCMKSHAQMTPQKLSCEHTISRRLNIIHCFMRSKWHWNCHSHNTWVSATWCVPAYIPLHMYIVPNVIPRSICVWPRKSIRREYRITWLCDLHTCVTWSAKNLSFFPSCISILSSLV